LSANLAEAAGSELDMQDSRDIGLGIADTALEDAKAFNKGKGLLLAGMIAFLLLALSGFAWYLLNDQPNPYGELGKQVNGLRGQYFDAFWVCALPGKEISELKSDVDVREELDVRAAAGARYGAHLRKCVAPLRDLSPRLRALLPPADAQVAVKAMADGGSKTSTGASDFAAYLENLEQGYDAVRGAKESETLVRGWYEFRKAHGELNTLIKSKLGR
jgi:hypothetical protein